MPIPKVAAIHDLSGLGKCSLTAAIPVLAAMGVQAVPLPTAVLSSQTGFPGYDCVDLTEHMAGFAAQWKRIGTRFAGVYTGFLCNTRQVALASGFLEEFAAPETVVLVDPVLGDEGRIYPVFDREMCRAVEGLVERADAITPNLTEACLLTGGDYAALSAGGPQPVWELAEALSRRGPRTVVITGVHQGDQILNLGYCADGGRFCVGTRRIGQGRSGTGDLLASVLCGGLVTGLTARESLERAAALLEAAISESCDEGADPQEGVAFEHHLRCLM